MQTYQVFIFLFFFSVFKTFGQSQEVKGVIITEEKDFVEGVSVYLMQENSHKMIQSAITNEKGQYTIQVPSSGKYHVKASFVGYFSVQSPVFESKGQSINIDTLVLLRKESALETVEIEHRLPKIQMRDGKMIMDVENSALATGNNAMEIIKRAPGVSVDNEDKILLMGQAGVSVTIDGRETYMSREQLADFLKSTDGDQIKSIEVSTTRSAKEEAEGGVGRINIVLKKNKIEGFTGTLNATAGQGRRFRTNTSLSLNYKINGTSLFGSYGHQKARNVDEIDILRMVPDQDEETLFDQKMVANGDGQPHNYRFGIEQKTSDRNIITLQWSGLVNTRKQKSESFTYITDTKNLRDQVLNSQSDMHSPFQRHTLNLNNEFKIDTTGKKVAADLDWSQFKNDQKIDYFNQIFDNKNEKFEDEEIRRGITHSLVEILAGKIDYEQSIGEGKLETGAKYGHVKTDNNLIYEDYISGEMQPDVTQSNHFVYTEEILAAYADYAYNFEKWGLKAGLRAEHTLSEGNSITLKEVENRKYLDLFPSLNIHYNVSDHHMLNAAYAKKITRPNYSLLNPFEYYLDKYTSIKGNPFLKPQYTNSFTLTYTLLNRFMATFGYDFTYDAIVESMGQNPEEKTTWVYRENLANQQTGYININAPFQIKGFWDINNNFTFLHLNYDGPMAGAFIQQKSFAFQGSSMHSFRLEKGFSSELNIQYMSPFQYNMYKISSKWNADIAFTKKFKDERSTLKFSVSDVFKTDDLHLRSDFDSYYSVIDQRFDSRIFRLTFSYSIGNLKQKMKHSWKDTEEQSRAM